MTLFLELALHYIHSIVHHRVYVFTFQNIHYTGCRMKWTDHDTQQGNGIQIVSRMNLLHTNPYNH